MNFHHGICSYSASRRSWHDVRSCQIRAPKWARSFGVSSATGPKPARIAPSTEPTSPGLRGNRTGTLNVGRSYWLSAQRAVGTRWPAALTPSVEGMRSIVSTTCR